MAPAPDALDGAGGDSLEAGAYEIIRNRLAKGGKALQERLEKLNAARKAVFGAIETKLLATEHITTDHSCIPRDMAPIGDRFIFGYNVHIGLKSQIALEDVFSVYRLDGRTLVREPLDLIGDETFARDFQELFKYYKNTVFAKFSFIGPHLFMVFRVGKNVTDVKVFKWAVDGDALRYMDNRSDHEYRFPPQHEFEWKRTHRDMHYQGRHPHVSIEDRVFVETVGGDLTVKVENNTESGLGIYQEPVEDKDQTLDDAEFFYAIVGNLILLKIRPYQENAWRYLVFCEKNQKVYRIDAIQESCVLLPEEHGIIHANGYVLQTGEQKSFGGGYRDMLFEKRLPSSNGEDYLFVFYNREKGDYVLLSYNVITQTVDTPIPCNGYSIFKNGEMIYFKAAPEAQRNHALQIWQTPYRSADLPVAEQSDSMLFKIGNKDIVRGMADCNEVLNLIAKEDSYANLYGDIVKKISVMFDVYHWIGNEETFNLKVDLSAIRDAGQAAISEFEKVSNARRNAKEQLAAAAAEADEITKAAGARLFESIHDFVDSLAGVRACRGRIIALRDVKYMDLPAVEALQEGLAGLAEDLGQRCVEFLLRPESLAPYEKAVQGHAGKIDGLQKVSDARALGEEIDRQAADLELLIDVVSNLRIEDATQRTAIIDAISEIFATLNKTRSHLKNKTRDLGRSEGIAEFNSQIKLLNQAVANYIDLCDTIPKCDEYLTRVMVQIEELEGRFAEFDEFVMQLTEKREEAYNAFESRKIQLQERQNKRATALMQAADRILNGIKSRVATFKAVEEIHAYFASDLMIEKVRGIIDELRDLGDTVKLDDVQSRLKTIGEDAVRQLKDRLDLFTEGENVIRFGAHKFTVNTFDLALTTVMRDGEMYFHLAGTNYFDPIRDEAFLATRDLWSQEVMSENDSVYRAEYLAYLILEETRAPGGMELEELRAMSPEALQAFIQKYMGSRYSEGYVKGVHDHDAALILRALLDMEASIGLLAFHPIARALASVFWHQFREEETKARIASTLKGFGVIRELFGDAEAQRHYTAELHGLIDAYLAETEAFDPIWAGEAARYLFEILVRGGGAAISENADRLYQDFLMHLKKNDFAARFEASLNEARPNPNSAFLLCRDWAGAFVRSRGVAVERDYVDETAALILTGDHDISRIIHATSTAELSGLAGSHALLEGGKYLLNYNTFMARLAAYRQETVPRYEAYVARKKQLVEDEAVALRLDEFKPRVLTSFVRNRLIDNVYLPLIGDNLAKQIGAAGDQKRTDRSGMLLLISPPGYGKTTLMEYIANRLGLIFMKINGPALGHQVTSLDPSEATNAAAREELAKLNLALEMGDNVMLYVDDIQHCNPEFLQKFISLCDAQRKIEGVHKGRTRTYDLRGKKVAVVMAGNPYTESGEKFQIPDMLANRADTYNLGEIIGDSADDFETSYLENCLTSNPVLNQLAARSQDDVYAIIRMAQTGSREGIDLKGSFSLDEVNSMVNVMKKLLFVRDTVLTVNKEYIRSAGIHEDYRTEPAFKLQGSYRNMNRIAERVLDLLNDAELRTLINSSYEGDSQTLTSGAEANMLKFKELTGQLSESEAERWASIKKTFTKNLKLKGLGDDQAVGQVLVQLGSINDGLESIAAAMKSGAAQMAASREATEAAPVHEPVPTTVNVVSKVPAALVGVMSEQFKLMQGWLAPIFKETREQTEEMKRLKALMDENLERYQVLLDELQDK
ncbi:MAG: DNA repair ATPase [Candidatus Hydrogenedentes bacterium]|nr:DNA repair ATPase [Candidatus Hydrogenedentota bacterium]